MSQPETIRTLFQGAITLVVGIYLSRKLVIIHDVANHLAEINASVSLALGHAQGELKGTLDERERVRLKESI